MLDEINAASPWHRLYREEIARKLERVLPANGRILDAGGGTGIFASRLVEQGHSVTVIDVVPEMLDLVAEKRRGLGGAGERLELLLGDIEHLEELDLGEFDAAICTQVLNFCRRPDKVFAGIAGVLKPGAPFVCDIDGAYRWSLIELLAGHTENALAILRSGTDEARHIVGAGYWFLDHRHASRQLEMAGFSALDVRGVLHFAPYLHILAPSEAFLDPEGVASAFAEPDALQTLRELERCAAMTMPIESAGWVQLTAIAGERRARG